MVFGKIVCGPVLLASALCLAGCAVDTGDSTPLDGEDIAATEQPWTVDSSGSAQTLEWDSGEINNLSAWKSRKCSVLYGDNYMLTDLRPFKEETGNADNFVGKLDGTCTDYSVATGNQTGSKLTANIFTSTSYRADGGYPIAVASTKYPTGLKLQVNSADGYVKDFQIAFDSRNATGTAITNVHSLTATATGYGGTDVNLYCSDQKVMTGMQVIYDTDKGKIRRVQVFCRTITN